MSVLERIESPADLKTLSIEELTGLGAEIRQYIIEVVSHRGGHLASSLGAVEITLALHYVFDSPRDKILWDVGHQSYAHKIITGRREQFKGLRTRGGLSGFPCVAESEHDIFGVGHASTAISAALGFAVSRDLRGESGFVVAVVGDGALSGGLAFEGINQAGHLKKNRFIIVLNDNEMSISRNVGALSRYLTKITTKKLYLQFEADVYELIGKIPNVGGKARKLARRIKESIKNLVLPNIVFEELGFRYFGPLDGHDLAELVSVFRQIRDVPGPVLVHVMTKKGKGYPFAEENAERFHGIGSFYKATGNSKSDSTEPTYSEVFGGELVALAARDPAIVAVTAAMKEGTGLAPFAAAYPGRFFDVGIAEQHAVTFAAALALAGYKPVVAIYSTFLQRALDQIIHDVALQSLPVRFVLDRAGLVGEDGATHHGAFDLSYLRLVPNMVIMAPMDGEELRAMLRAALARAAGPTAIRIPRGAAPAARRRSSEEPIEIGKGEIVREGTDAALVAIGSMVPVALDAAEALRASGVEAAVVNARFAKPLDRDLLSALARRGVPIVTVEENARAGGFGDAVISLLSELAPGTRSRVIGMPDRFVPHGKRSELLEEAGLTSAAAARAVLDLLADRTPGNRGGTA